MAKNINPTHSITYFVEFFVMCEKLICQLLTSSKTTNMEILEKPWTQKGKGSSKKKAEPLTNHDEEKLWKSGLLGDHSPTALLNTIFYMCGLFFALRRGAEHR